MQPPKSEESKDEVEEPSKAQIDIKDFDKVEIKGLEQYGEESKDGGRAK